MPNRYEHLEQHADAGLGAEEFEQVRRFTRPTERTPASRQANAEVQSTNSQKEN